MEQIERVARAMCKADNRDPDEVVTVTNADSLYMGNVPKPTEPAPRWHIYVPEARRIIAAHRAL